MVRSWLPDPPIKEAVSRRPDAVALLRRCQRAAAVAR